MLLIINHHHSHFSSLSQSANHRACQTVNHHKSVHFNQDVEMALTIRYWEKLGDKKKKRDQQQDISRLIATVNKCAIGYYNACVSLLLPALQTLMPRVLSDSLSRASWTQQCWHGEQIVGDEWCFDAGIKSPFSLSSFVEATESDYKYDIKAKECRTADVTNIKRYLVCESLKSK